MVLFVLNEQIVNRRAAIKEWPMVMYWSMYHGYILQSALISNLIWDVGNGDVYSWSSLEEKLWQSRQCIKKQRHYFAEKSPYSQVSEKWKSLSRVWLFVTPWNTESMEFSRPEYWSG